LHYLAESKADWPDGYVTSNRGLADLLGWHERTVRRTLRTLRAHRLISFEDHPGVAAFTIRTTAALAALEEEPRTAPRTLGVEVVSEVASDTPGPTSPLNVPSVKGKLGGATSDSRAGAETETEKKPLPTNRSGATWAGEGGDFQSLDGLIAAELTRLRSEAKGER
jgi:hypothetical protein